METNLAKWVGAHRAWLIRQVAEKVQPSPGAERRFFDELLRRLTLSESASDRHLAPPIEPKDAAKIMGVNWGGSGDQSVYPVAVRLRDKIRDASKLMNPNPAVYLTRAPYLIEVEEKPPASNRNDADPCIGLILADANDWFVGDLLKGISQECHGKYNLLVELSTYSQQTEARLIQRLADRVHGLLVVPVGNHVLKTATRALRENHCVLIDRYLQNVDLPCVHPADKSAGRHAALQLKMLGCKRVIVVNQGSRSGTDFSITPLSDRVDGCQEADDDLEVIALPEAGTDEQGGLDALKRFDAESHIKSSDGILALTDRVAVGCQNYLRTQRPDLDVPLISIEGQTFGDFIQPQLLSIRFNNFEMGRLAAEILMAKIEGRPFPEGTPRNHYLIAPSLLRPTGSAKRQVEPLSVEA